MKKFITFSIIVLSSLFLASCKDTTEVPDDPIIIDEPKECEVGQELDVETDLCIDIILTDFTVVANKEVVDLMYHYSIGDKGMDIYNYKEDETSYVNIESFMNQTQKLMKALEFTENNGLEVSYTQKLYSPYANMYGTNELVYTTLFDPSENTITVNDFDFFSVINAPIESPMSQLTIDSLEYFGPPEVTVVALDDYDMHIYEEDGNYYIPLFLASLFITGDMVNVYETSDSIVLFDTGADFDDLEYIIDQSPMEADINILSTSENYLKLYFEYFYGLDEEFGYDFDSLIESYDLDEQSTFHDFYTEFDQFLIDLDDIHTSLITPGYNDNTYTPKINFEVDSRWDTMFEAINENSCYFLPEEFDLYTVDTTMYVTVNGFSENTIYLVHDIILNSIGVEDIVIDLRCNGGGMLLGVLELMTLLTDSPIPLNIYNPQTNTYEKQNIVNSLPRALDVNFFVLTSEVTFSGGNLFASLVRDLDAGILIGTPTSGGACAINLSIMPDGSIFVVSSNTVLMNASDETTEFGVAPDVLITEYIEFLTEFDFRSYLE